MTTTVTKKEFNSVESERFSYRDLRSCIRAALEDGPWLRNENCKHFKLAKNLALQNLAINRKNFAERFYFVNRRFDDFFANFYFTQNQLLH